MNTRKRIPLLILVMAIIVIGVGSIILFILYDVVIKQERERLQETAQSQARLIESIAQYNQEQTPTATSTDLLAAVLRQLRVAYDNFEGFGETGEFTLARRDREANQIVFLLTQRHYGLESLEPIPWEDNRARPMWRALSGQSGTMIGLDYRGATVLAAYEPVHIGDDLELGIVAKIDLAEIQQPFIRAGLLAGGSGLILILVGTLLFISITNPILRRIEESEARYRFLFEGINDAIMVYDPNGHFADCNQVALQRLGYSHAEFLRLTPAAIVHPDFHAVMTDNQAKIQNGNTTSVESMHITKDGQAIPVEVTAHTINYRGENVIFAVARDITERQQAEAALRASEERYRSLFNGVPVGLYRTAPDGQIVDANRALLEMLGYSDRESLLKTPVSSVFADPTDRQRWQTRMEQEGVVSGFELQNRRTDGTVIWVEDSARTVRDDAGQVLYYEGSLRDITERKQVEEELAQYRDHLEELIAERAKELRVAQEQLIRQEKLALLGQLAGGVGHELRNPLGVIANAVYFLKLTLANADATTQEYLEIVASEVNNAEKIVADLLDFARIRSAEQSETPLSSLAHDLLLRRPPPENISVTVAIDPELPPVFVDSRQIGQVVTNLITNACQAMPNGGELTLRAEVIDRRIQLAVLDTGVGIPTENLGKIFEPLFTTKPKGIGLGLAVSKNLIEINGGSITVASTIGKGSTFTITLPIQEAGK